LEELIAVSALPLADGPAYYFGSTILTFALPFGALIAAAIALFFLFRATHSGPRLRWSSDGAAHIASVTTREPGPASAPAVAPQANAAAPAVPAPTATAPKAAVADDNTADDRAADDETEGKDGEHG
jgi:hypothetical protein